MQLSRKDLLIKTGLIADPKDNFEVAITLDALNGVPDDVIIAAYKYHKLNSPYKFQICNIKEYADKMTGKTQEALELEASEIYQKYFSIPSTGKDILCENKRAAYAFQVAFGNFKKYGSDVGRIDSIDRRDFIKAYVNADPRNYEHANNILEGYNHNSKDCQVVIIGDQTKGAMLAKKIYGEQVRLSLDKPKPTPLQLENKAAEEKQGTPATKEQVEGYLKRIDECFNSMFLNKRTV